MKNENVCVKYLHYKNEGKFGGGTCECRGNAKPMSRDNWRQDKGRIWDHVARQKHLKFLQERVTKQEYDDHMEALLKHYKKGSYDELKKYFQDKNKIKSTDSEDVDIDIIHQNGNDSLCKNDDSALSSIAEKTISLLSNVLEYIDPKSSISKRIKEQRIKQDKFDAERAARRKRMENFLFTGDLKLNDNNIELYQSAMGSIRLMHKMALTNVPIYRFAEWAETIGNFGGYKMKSHLSQTSATEWLLILGEAQRKLDIDEIKNAKTVFATIDAQSSSKDSWTAILSNVRDRNGIKKIIFTYGEYLVNKTAIEAANEKQIIENAKVHYKPVKKRKQRIPRFQLCNVNANDIIMSNEVDVDVVSNGNNGNHASQNQNDNETFVKPSKQLQLLFESVYNKIGLNWNKLNGECSDGGQKEKAGMQLVCYLLLV